MPILGREVDLYPNDLLEQGASENSDRQWWGLYTKARQEKALARQLARWQIPFYLPLVSKTFLRAGRKTSAFHPLFAGYVFLFGSEEERVQCLTTNRISRVLTVDDPAQLCYDLCQIHKLIAVNAPLTVESRLSPGARVRVRQGPFAGVEGVVLNRRGQTRLLVSINFLQRGASVEIDDFLLEPLE